MATLTTIYMVKRKVKCQINDITDMENGKLYFCKNSKKNKFLTYIITEVELI